LYKKLDEQFRSRTSGKSDARKGSFTPPTVRGDKKLGGGLFSKQEKNVKGALTDPSRERSSI